MAHRPLAAVPLAFVAAVVAACGGGGGGGPAPAARPPVVVQPPVVPPPPQNRPPVQTTKDSSTNLELSARTLITIDLSMGGTVFSDPDGDPLTYRLLYNGETLGDGPWLTLAAGDPAVPYDPDKFIGSRFFVTIQALDPAGSSTEHYYYIERFWNLAPVVANPNRVAFAAPNETVTRDLLQGGSTFTEPDGDLLTYSVEIIAPPGQAFSIQGTNVSGRLSAAGLAGRFAITATDGDGTSATDVFVIATAVPEPGPPTLLAPGYEYEDPNLPLPWLFRLSADTLMPFWDTGPTSTNRSGLGAGFPSNAGATLGRVLFYDKRLSVTNTHSCATCHVQSLSFTTAERFPTGVLGAPLRRNAMQLANVRYNLVERWFGDLRVDLLEKLVLMPIEDPTELGNPLPLVEEKLAATAFYPPLFEAAFGTRDVTAERIAKALSQFLRALITYRSRYDQAYLSMQSAPPIPPDPARVLTAEELYGAQLFHDNGCPACHEKDLQIMDRGVANNGLDVFPADPGSGEGNFRATSLRNIEVSAPYMHDGRFATLREVIDHYDHGVADSPFTSGLLRETEGNVFDANGNRPIRQLNLSEDDKIALEAFLNTLTDTEMLADPKFSDPF